MRLALLEAPGAAITLAERLWNRETISVDQAQIVLSKALEPLDGPLAANLKTSPKVQAYLGRGFEATAFSFDTKDGRWVVKIGLPKNCVPGVYSPATDRYAAMMKWNYAVLCRAFSQCLPHVMSSPYFVVSPSESGGQTTVQILPYVCQLADMSLLAQTQKDRLIKERQEFFQISRKMLREDRVMPDLVGSRNLIVGKTDGNEPHFTLIDFGLFHLQAPTPVLNLLVYSFQKLSLLKDTNSLKKRSSSAATAPQSVTLQ